MQAETIGGAARKRQSRRVLSAGTLNGDRVRNAEGEDLGKIEEIMIDLETGRIAYAVLSFGGFMGLGDKLFAIPWGALEVDETNHELLLNASKETLKSAPGFDKDNWPDMADPSFGTLVHEHFATQPFWEHHAEAYERPWDGSGVRPLAEDAATRERINQPDMPQELRRHSVDVTDFPGRSEDDDLRPFKAR